VPIRILIVEDDKHIRRILETLLAHDAQLAAREPQLTLAQDGKEGLETFDKTGPYDLIISDLLMPRMDGFTFTREVRKHRMGKTVPIIVTSAIYKDPQTMRKLQVETQCEFFSKPFQVKELLGAVRRLLGDGGKKREVIAPPLPAKVSPTTGALADRAPPRLLLELFEERATGQLTLLRGQVRKVMALLHGTPVAVDSNLRTETLGHFLVARGVLDERQHRDALARAKQSHDRVGAVLIEMGFLSEQELLKQLAAQMRAKIMNLLRWREGTWTFAPGQPPVDRLQTPVDLPRVIFTGLQKTAHVDEIAQQVVKARGRIALTLRTERHRETFARVFGTHGLEAMARRPLVEELMAGADQASMLIQLDALLICGMADVEPVPVAKQPPAEGSDPASLERIVRPERVQRAPLKPNLYDELFGDEPTYTEEPPSEQPSIADAPDDEDSGVMTLPTDEPPKRAPEPARAVAQPDPAIEALRKEVLAEYVAIHGKDYYQALDVGRDAAVEDIAAAYAAIGKRFRLERFAGVDLGRDYARLEEIHQILRSAFETLTSRSEREAYDKMLSTKVAPSRAALNADLLAQEASALLSKGDVAGARAKLADAVQYSTDQADYHAMLGWVTFLAEGGQARAAQPMQIHRAAQMANPHLDRALVIDPDNLDAHDYAGRIAAAAGDDDTAIAHLERVLDADPTRGDALMALEGAHTRRSDWPRLEKQYRKLIHRLGDAQDPERALRLWWRLAELYRTRLNDASSAKVAYEIAAKLAPDDPRPREALARLFAEDPRAWEKAALALRESWRLAPEDPAPGRALFKLHADAERWDAALTVAQALACRGVDAPEAVELMKRFRPRFLQRAQTPISDALFARIRHPDDQPELETLFAHVFHVWRPSFTLLDLGVAAGDRVAELPETFARVLFYVAQELAVDSPPVFKRGDFGAEAHVGAMMPPILLAGPHALAQADRVELAFRLGRALTYLRGTRGLAGALPSRQLKQLMLAALTLVQPGLKADDSDGQIAKMRALLGQSHDLASKLAPVVNKLLSAGQQTLNLSRFSRAMARTAERVGLLLCGDLPVAWRAVGEGSAPGAADDLLDFSLSVDYLQAREQLGLSVAV
jgi:CheY-like chemotaxis protein/tetratricopeptide (TPR) repeat protein